MRGSAKMEGGKTSDFDLPDFTEEQLNGIGYCIIVFKRLHGYLDYFNNEIILLVGDTLHLQYSRK